MISLSTADSALKNVYLDVIKNELNNEMDPFYSKIKKTSQDITGNEIRKMVTIGVNGGIGAGSEVGSLPKAGMHALCLWKLCLPFAKKIGGAAKLRLIFFFKPDPSGQRRKAGCFHKNRPKTGRYAGSCWQSWFLPAGTAGRCSGIGRR